MGFFKFFLGVIFASASAVAPEGDGWFPVEKVPQAEEVMTDIDPSIWVLFLKKLGSDQISLRFPVDPVYRTTEDGFIARAANGGEIFELTFQKGLGEAGSSLYEADGKWVHEHVVQSGDHIYKLRTYSLLPESLNHAEFVSSFSLVLLTKNS